MLETISELTVGQLLGGGISAVALLGLLLEVAPIKLNPWTAVLSAIGKRLNKDVTEKVDKLAAEVSAQGERIDDNERDRIRYEILDFANSCRNCRRHSSEEFNHIFELKDKYHDILDRREEANGKIDRDMEYITTLYRRCQEQNDLKIKEKPPNH